MRERFVSLRRCRHDWVAEEGGEAAGVPGNALGAAEQEEDRDNDGWEPEWWEVRRPRYRWEAAGEDEGDGELVLRLVQG